MSIQGRFLGQTKDINLDEPTLTEAIQNLDDAILYLIDLLINKQFSQPGYRGELAPNEEIDSDVYFTNRLVASDITMTVAANGGACNKSATTLKTCSGNLKIVNYKSQHNDYGIEVLKRCIPELT